MIRLAVVACWLVGQLAGSTDFAFVTEVQSRYASSIAILENAQSRDQSRFSMAASETIKRLVIHGSQMSAILNAGPELRLDGPGIALVAKACLAGYVYAQTLQAVAVVPAVRELVGSVADQWRVLSDRANLMAGAVGIGPVTLDQSSSNRLSDEQLGSLNQLMRDSLELYDHSLTIYKRLQSIAFDAGIDFAIQAITPMGSTFLVVASSNQELLRVYTGHVIEVLTDVSLVVTRIAAAARAAIRQQLPETGDLARAWTRISVRISVLRSSLLSSTVAESALTSSEESTATTTTEFVTQAETASVKSNIKKKRSKRRQGKEVIVDDGDSTGPSMTSTTTAHVELSEVQTIDSDEVVPSGSKKPSARTEQSTVKRGLRNGRHEATASSGKSEMKLSASSTSRSTEITSRPTATTSTTVRRMTSTTTTTRPTTSTTTTTHRTTSTTTTTRPTTSTTTTTRPTTSTTTTSRPTTSTTTTTRPTTSNSATTRPMTSTTPTTRHTTSTYTTSGPMASTTSTTKNVEIYATVSARPMTNTLATSLGSVSTYLEASVDDSSSWETISEFSGTGDGAQMRWVGNVICRPVVDPMIRELCVRAHGGAYSVAEMAGLCRQILRQSPPGSEAHIRARQMLRTLDRARSALNQAAVDSSMFVNFVSQFPDLVVPVMGYPQFASTDDESERP